MTDEEILRGSPPVACERLMHGVGQGCPNNRELSERASGSALKQSPENRNSRILPTATGARRAADGPERGQDDGDG